MLYKKPAIPLNEHDKKHVVEWIPANEGNLLDGSEVVVYASVFEMDELFQNDTGFYVGPQGEGGIAGRYLRFHHWMTLGKPVKMPEAGLHDNAVVFTNGRHRFAWMRDFGAKVIPVQIPADQLWEWSLKIGDTPRYTYIKNLPLIRA